MLLSTAIRTYHKAEKYTPTDSIEQIELDNYKKGWYPIKSLLNIFRFNICAKNVSNSWFG